MRIRCFLDYSKISGGFRVFPELLASAVYKITLGSGLVSHSPAVELRGIQPEPWCVDLLDTVSLDPLVGIIDDLIPDLEPEAPILRHDPLADPVVAARLLGQGISCANAISPNATIKKAGRTRFHNPIPRLINPCMSPSSPSKSFLGHPALAHKPLCITSTTITEATRLMRGKSDVETICGHSAITGSIRAGPANRRGHSRRRRSPDSQ